MALSIKDPETDRMARELAALRGTTLTQAIADALRHELNRLAPARLPLTPKQQAMVDDIMAIAKRGAPCQSSTMPIRMIFSGMIPKSVSEQSRNGH